MSNMKPIHCPSMALSNVEINDTHKQIKGNGKQVSPSTHHQKSVKTDACDNNMPQMTQDKALPFMVSRELKDRIVSASTICVDTAVDKLPGIVKPIIAKLIISLRDSLENDFLSTIKSCCVFVVAENERLLATVKLLSGNIFDKVSGSVELVRLSASLKEILDLIPIAENIKISQHDLDEIMSTATTVLHVFDDDHATALDQLAIIFSALSYAPEETIIKLIKLLVDISEIVKPSRKFSKTDMQLIKTHFMASVEQL